VKEILSLYLRALLLATASLWRGFSVVVGVGMYAAVVWLAHVAAPIAIAIGVVLLLLAGQVGALRIAHSAEGELTVWRGRQVQRRSRLRPSRDAAPGAI
jgi:hypothetical protein